MEKIRRINFKKVKTLEEIEKEEKMLNEILNNYKDRYIKEKEKENKYMSFFIKNKEIIKKI